MLVYEEKGIRATDAAFVSVPRSRQFRGSICDDFFAVDAASVPGLGVCSVPFLYVV
jgi:hypothetical protein